LVLVAGATVTCGDGQGHCWKNDQIVFAANPVYLFSFLLDTVVNGVLSMIMLVARVAESGGGDRKSELALG
jgi:hypothetical protein